MTGRLGMTGRTVERGDSSVLRKSYMPKFSPNVPHGWVRPLDMHKGAYRGMVTGKARQLIGEQNQRTKRETQGFKDIIARRHQQLAGVGSPAPGGVHELEHSTMDRAQGPVTQGFHMKTGGPQAKSHMFVRPGANSTVVSHELAHGTPKRSAYRLHQISQDPHKVMREEARADFRSGQRLSRPNPEGMQESNYMRAARSEQARGTVHAEFSAKSPGRARNFEAGPVGAYRDVMSRMEAGEARRRPVSKASVNGRQKRDHSGAAVGSGAALSTAGLIGGGVPGARPDSGRLAQARRGTKAEATRHLVSAARGGVFGYRADAHQRFLNQQNADELAHRGAKTTRVNHYLRGRGTGKITPEKQIIEHMRAARVGSNYALAGGTVLLGTGIHQRRQRKTVAKNDNFRSNALVAGGATTAAGAGAGSLVLRSQGRKWAKRSAASLEEARRINPKLGGYDVKQTRHGVPDVVPHRSSNAHIADRKVFAGRSSKATEAAGQLRGAAAQHRYFAGVYGSSARLARKVGGAGVLIGATGLADRNLEVRRRPVSKALPAGHGVKIPRWQMQWKMNDATPAPSARYKVPPIKVPGAHEVSAEHLATYPRVTPGKRKRTLVDRYLGREGTSNKFDFGKVETTMSEHEAKRIAAQYDTRGPLPKGLSREQKMKAYEGRYVASGGRKAEKWHHRASAAELGRNIGLAGVTAASGGYMAVRGKRTGPALRRIPKIGQHLTPHKVEAAGATAGVLGGGSELYGEYARHRRASYQNSPGGVAGSALSRMQAYTPEKKT